jgi:hypothetical protein
MTRRLILATCMLGVIGGTAGTALASSPVTGRPHELCLVLTKADNTTQDYCINWTGAPTKP